MSLEIGAATLTQWECIYAWVTQHTLSWKYRSINLSIPVPSYYSYVKLLHDIHIS